MNTEIRGMYGSQLAALAATLKDDWAWPSAEAGFAWHVFHALSESGPVPNIVNATWPSADPLHQAPALAAAGYMLAAHAMQITTAERTVWAAGLERLSQKNAFPADRQSFVYRPLEVLGIAMGISHCAEVQPPSRQWFRSVIERLMKEGFRDVWSQALIAVAGMETGITIPNRVSVAFDLVGLEELAMVRWVAKAHASVPFIAPVVAQLRSVDASLLKRAATEVLPVPDIARAAVLFASLRAAVYDGIDSTIAETWQVGRQAQDAARVVESLCRRFHLFARQILQRHQNRSTISMADEYDVQDALHALLRLHFDDVRAEEVSPSYAGKSTRMDFLLKREKIVVETKMTRKNLDQNDVANELIEDKERYRTHPGFRTLICLVYDPAHICHNPTALEDDVSGEDGDFRCIVIVTPKGM